MSFPHFYAGQVLTADRLSARDMLMVTQENDQTVTSSTTFVKSEIKFLAEANALYAYWLYLSYSAGATGDLKWEWDSDATTGVLMAAFTQAYNLSATSGSNDGASIIMRRPGNTTDRVAGGSDVANFHSAYDSGTFSTNGAPTEHAMYFAQNTSNATGTILRGGNQTRFLYARIA